MDWFHVSEDFYQKAWYHKWHIDTQFSYKTHDLVKENGTHIVELQRASNELLLQTFLIIFIKPYVKLSIRTFCDYFIGRKHLALIQSQDTENNKIITNS
jgi:hypothetical protein